LDRSPLHQSRTNIRARVDQADQPIVAVVVRRVRELGSSAYAKLVGKREVGSVRPRLVPAPGLATMSGFEKRHVGRRNSLHGSADRTDGDGQVQCQRVLPLVQDLGPDGRPLVYSQAQLLVTPGFLRQEGSLPELRQDAL